LNAFLRHHIQELYTFENGPFLAHPVSGFSCKYPCIFWLSGSTSSEYLLKIQRLQTRLSEIIEPDFGLLHELLSRGVISDRDHANVEAGESLVSVYQRNDRLLHRLSTSLTEQQYQQLLSALEDTRQTHVANFIRSDGGLFLKTTHFVSLPALTSFCFTPPYLTDELCRPAVIEGRRCLCSASSPSLIVRRTRLSTVSDRAFPVAASLVWNDLPQHVTAAESLPVFCSRLKTHLFRRCFLWHPYCCRAREVTASFRTR